MWPKLIFINGPKGSGKSTLSRALCDADMDIWQESMADPIRQAIYATFFPEQQPLPDFDLRDGPEKAKPFPWAPSMSFRDVMISFSEEWMKKKFGPDIFGKLALKRCREQETFYEAFLFDDSGFAAEARPLIDYFGELNTLLVQLHRDGCDYHGDSRGYIDLGPSIRTIKLENNGTIADLLGELQLELGAL